MTLTSSADELLSPNIGLGSNGRGVTTAAIPRPGLLEQSLTIMIIFINQFGTPASWFRTTETRVVESDFILTYGSLAILGLLMLGLIGNGDAVVRVLSAAPLLVAYFMVIGFSPLWSGYFGASVNAVANLAIYVGLAVVLLVRHTWTDILRLITFAMAVGILMDLFWVLAMGPIGSGPAGWTGLNTQKNGLGGDGLLALIFFILAARTFRRFRVPLYGLAAIALVLLIGSESKTALGTALVTAACFVVFMAFRARKTLNGAVFLTLASGVTVSLLFVTANLASIAGQFGKDATFTGRTPLWGEAWAGVLEQPWLGYGFRGFFNGPLSPAHRITAYEPFQWNPTHAHNALLESALHVGIPATILLLALHCQSLVRATRHVRLVKGPLGLFPLVYLTMITILSTTESGIFGMRFGLTMFVVAVVQAKVGADDAHRRDASELDGALVERA